MIIVIALLIAGFMARRLMMPPAVRYLAPRAQDDPVAPAQSGAAESNHAPMARGDQNGSGEHLNASDRRALDEVIRRKTESH